MNISKWLDKKEAEGIDVSLHRQSSFFYRRAIRPLVLLPGTGKRSRPAYDKPSMVDVHQRHRPRD
jgi:hypothetical protein